MLVGAVGVGLAAQGIGPAVSGFVRIQAHPARLLNDFTVVGGEGGALLNAGIVAVMGLLLVRFAGIRFSGPTIAAVFTMFGFGLFGKTPVNIIPIIAGVALAARVAGKTFQEYILMALFGTALGPLIIALAVEAGLPTPAALGVCAIGGLAAGMVLPSVAIAMLRLHQGFNLYNIGMTCGFIGTFAAGVLVAAGFAPSAGPVWNADPSTVLVLLIPGISVVLLTAGLLAGPSRSVKDALRITTLTGRLPSDFMTMTSAGGSLVNAGLLGVLLWVYVVAIGGPLNGPVLGGILTAVGFATFGKHPRNAWPPLAGVVIACLVFGKDLASPGPLLAALFVLTLAPLAGEFGWGMGIIAGFLHLVMVERTGGWHLGINLYNNGFAGGLTATLLVALIQWFRSTREESRRPSQRRAVAEEQGEES